MTLRMPGQEPMNAGSSGPKERLLPEGPPPRSSGGGAGRSGYHSATALPLSVPMSQGSLQEQSPTSTSPVSVSTLRPGDILQVWSKVQQRWLDATVQDVVQRDAASEGHPGGVRVISDGGMQTVPLEQVSQLLRWPRRAPGASPTRRNRVPRPKPTGRPDVGGDRLQARDSWNTNEIKIQEIFHQYDKDNSNALEVEEFRCLLRDFNEGRDPKDEEFDFILRLADKNHDGKIELNELHYALRAWNSYNQLDASVLELFAEFDFDDSGRLDADELQQLLTAINGGKTVIWEEVRHVMRQGDVLGDGLIHRSELLGAIAAWYAHVDRKDTDIPTLLREAVARTVMETTERSIILKDGHESLKQVASIVQSGLTGYSQVEASPEAPDEVQNWTRPPGGGPPSTVRQPAGTGSTSFASNRLSPSPSNGEADVPGPAGASSQALPMVINCLSKFCFATFPFILSFVLFISGWGHGSGECPRNLAGLLVWFSILLTLFGAGFYINDPDAFVDRARLAMGVMLALLNLVGLCWTYSSAVQGHMTECGHLMVVWSMLVWTLMPVGSLGFCAHRGLAHWKGLKEKDQKCQEIII